MLLVFVCAREEEIYIRKRGQAFPATCLSVCSSDCLLVTIYATASSLEDYSVVLFVE